MRAASKDKWLEAHGIEHWTHFYTDYGVGLQKRFFGQFLKGEDNGWREQQPRVQLQIRHPNPERFVERPEPQWPIARTQWTKMYLDPVTKRCPPSLNEAEASIALRRDGRRSHICVAAADRGN